MVTENCAANSSTVTEGCAGLTIEEYCDGVAKRGWKFRKCQHLNSVLCLCHHILNEVAGGCGVVDPDGDRLAGVGNRRTVDNQIAIGTADWGGPCHMHTAPPTWGGLESRRRA